jgi:integrase
VAATPRTAPKRTKRQRRASWGRRRLLPSGRWQASYVGPNGQTYTAAATFDTKGQADAWLAQRHSEVARDEWRPQARKADRVTVASYCETWLGQRELKPRTREGYRTLLDRQILPTLGATHVDKLIPAAVRTWYSKLNADTPTQRAHAYALLKAICKTAVDDDLLAANPCRVRGAGQAKRVSRTKPATPDELAALVAAIPQRYKAMTALAGWSGLRFGELIELRRKDVDLKAGVVHVRRAATLVDGQHVIGTPKSDAGVRDAPIPPHLLPLVRQHLVDMGIHGREELLFPAAGDPGKHLRPGTLCKVFYPAREKIGRPDLRFHDLRHTAGSNATRVGANLAEVMALLGHSTPAAALRYQHVTEGRPAEIAAALSALAGGTRK